jgi:hypothetical protein
MSLIWLLKEKYVFFLQGLLFFFSLEYRARLMHMLRRNILLDRPQSNKLTNPDINSRQLVSITAAIKQQSS